MERRLNKKIDDYQENFKSDISKWLKTNNCKVMKEENDMTNNFVRFIHDYNSLIFESGDFKKRNRVKNIVSHCERCAAKRANGEQCTRRRQDGNYFCGTHIKGTPHGVCENEENKKTPSKQIEIWIEEIKGIHYYIDSDKNVYNAKDIVENKVTPPVIAKWELDSNGSYTIPQFE
tara:strand:+ start:329 stop:853 length:525 start_codon:yes stop_codon:yes gene_type:complete